nr:unnamed protein product [Digitaria exilis]
MQVGTPENVVAGVWMKDMPSDKSSNAVETSAEYSQFMGKAESVDYSRLSTSSSKREWCFMCELEKVMTEGKHGTSPVSPTGILSHLNEIGTSFGQGREEDAHEFLRCMSYERANKKLTISEAPNILTIALKRYKSGVFGKISKDVKFPEHLNLSQFMCETDDYSPVYSLYAVVVHHDVMNATNSGHYVCYVKDPQGKWHELDDSKVKPVSLKKVLSKCAYMLLYARCAPRAPDSVRKAMLDQGASPLGRGSFVSVQQGFVGSDSSSLFSSSDAGSSSTLSSESNDSTRNSARMDYGYIHGASDHMRPVSTMVIPEEDELNCLRQRSSINPSTSGHDMDQAGSL